VFTPKFLAPDIVNLGFTQIYLTLMIDGIGSQPFSATTLPPIKPASISCKEMVIHRSREQFSKPRAEVEKAINEWHGIVEAVPQVKKEMEQVVSLDTVVEKPIRVALDTVPTIVDVPMIVQRETVEEKRPEIKSESSKERSEVRTERALSRKEYGTHSSRRTTASEVRKTVAQTDTTTQKKYQPREFAKDTRTDGSLPNKKQFTDAVQSSKNLEDLRAVLRTMTKTDEPKKNEINKKDSATEETLKVDTKTRQPSFERTEEVPTTISTVKDTILFSPKSVRESATSTSVAPVVHESGSDRTFQVEKKAFVPTDDPLAPGKLERMMRVTGNDKTPLG
jgi:hypothetical protein